MKNTYHSCKVSVSNKQTKHICSMVFNATFNNISVILWRSVLLVEETGGPGENNTCRKSLTLSHNVVHLAHNISGDRH